MYQFAKLKKITRTFKATVKILAQFRKTLQTYFIENAKPNQMR